MDIEGFSGRILTAGDQGFAEACGIWNRAVTRSPRAVARCRTTADVAAAVRHARATGLPLAVRAGGHNFAGHALVDDGLVVGHCTDTLRVPEGRFTAVGEINETALERYEPQTLTLTGRRGTLTVQQIVYPNEFKLTLRFG
ncbi:FAD-binding protein [Thermoactinospora rubra]|uniref:FAD-binding protein n=1 Tax=Thermoactinospora rubra TaxID=1088767 RepID=UPI000A11B1E5|nr:FAD-binding protein [Thermoactinospora rubra]